MTGAVSSGFVGFLRKETIVRCGQFIRFVLIGSLSALAFEPAPAYAKELQGRLGLGFNAEFENFYASGGVPGISLKYGLSRNFAIEGIFGTTTSSTKNSVAAAKLFQNIFFETNLNFYAMVGGGVISIASASGAQFIGGMGVEFFIPGIESLGFAMETGGSFDNLSGSFALKTLGVSFLNAGMHFYF
jgi:hypothetical protein